MKTSEFYIKNGQLSCYGFACGYVEKKRNETTWKELYMEHSHFHVRQGKTNQCYSIWETFSSEELTKARKLYNSLK